MEDKNLLALEISRLKEIIKGLDGQRQLAVRTTLEIKAAERRGAMNMMKAVTKALQTHVDGTDITNGLFMEIVMQEWEKTQEKP